MRKQFFGKSFLVAAVVGALALLPLQGEAADSHQPIVLKTMGSTFFGGTVVHKENGDTFHGEHGYAQFYIPEKAHNYPIIMWHGIGQSGRSFESTPDGREGFQVMLPRRNWAVYIVDQPRRGRAGRTEAPSADTQSLIPVLTQESAAWNAFRVGKWMPPDCPKIFAGSKFPLTPAAAEQFFRQETQDTGMEPATPEYRWQMGRTMAALMARTGPAILMTYSYSGQYGWYTAMSAPKETKAVVAFEPGAFTFPAGEEPEDVYTKIPELIPVTEPQIVAQEEFSKLTKVPIVIIYGDNIATTPQDTFDFDSWRVIQIRAQQFVDTVNRHGGNAKLVKLPELGIYGNTHAPFADTNNEEIADLLEKCLHDMQVDAYDHPHQGIKEAELKEYTIPVPQEMK